jgi:hypothetical protein
VNSQPHPARNPIVMAEAKAGISPADRELNKANHFIHRNIDSLVFLI